MTLTTIRRLESWLSERWDGPGRIRAFLGKQLPRNVSWLHTLGGLLLLYLVLQLVTGILLALYYSPSPDQAYASVRYIREELNFGWFVYSLHRCGSSFVLVTAFLHFARSYFLASYKKPRELVWCSGILLGLLLTLFAFSGQLLPYDQRGYWAAVVGIRIAASAPLVGGAVHDLLTGGFGDIGATTLSRFFIAHVCVLPLVLFGLISLHLGLLQKVGSAGPVAGRPEPYHSFYPRQATRDLLASVAGAAALFLVAALVSFEDSGPSAPEAGGFVPRPEWYFYAHFELLRLLPADLPLLGTFILPNLLIGGLLVLPFLDRNPERSFARRKVMTSIGVLGVVSFVVLTAVGIESASAEAAAIRAAAAEAGGDTGLDPIARGRALFASKRHDCIKCHTIEGRGGDKGPDLTHVGKRLRADYLKPWIRRPTNFKPDTEMPAFEGSEQELDDIAQFLRSLK